MRTGTQLFILCSILAVCLCVCAVLSVPFTSFFSTALIITGIIYLLNIGREHLYVRREARLQEFEVNNYWGIVQKHPEVLSERARRGMGFES